VQLSELPGTDRKGLAGGLGCKDHLTRLPEVPGILGVGEPILLYFRRQLEAMGGRSLEVTDARPPGPRWRNCSPMFAYSVLYVRGKSATRT
jgi:hypothetical protein